jgi:DNA (cytosine-5)-methyltransferase 1
MAEFTHVDLFCGPGGFATGFEWAGFKTTFGLDIHEPSLRTFSHNHQHVPTILGDIREIESGTVKKLIGRKRPTVLSAGVPCEGFSMSNRNRTKFTDERNFLFVEFLRMAQELKPEVVLIENVANLARHDGGFFAQEIEAGIASLGYKTSSKILNAADFGVPQRRRRVMFIGFKSGYNFKWPAETHGNQEGQEKYITVGQALLEDLPYLSSGETKYRYEGPPRSQYTKFIRGRRRSLLNHQAPKHPQATIDRIARTKPGEPMSNGSERRHPPSVRIWTPNTSARAKYSRTRAAYEFPRFVRVSWWIDSRSSTDR